MPANYRHMLAYALFVIWFVSLCLPALGTANEKLALGADILLIGPLGMLNLQFGWLGNIFLLWGLRLMVRSHTTTVVCFWVTAGLIGSAVSSAFFPSWPEGQKAVITHGPGYDGGMTSLIVLAFALCARATLQAKRGSNLIDQQ